jgi:hypothetical protein
MVELLYIIFSKSPSLLISLVVLELLPLMVHFTGRVAKGKMYRRILLFQCFNHLSHSVESYPGINILRDNGMALIMC